MRTRGATLGLATMLPGLVLVIVIFWALAAVLMLTGTLINAREIDDTVEVINQQLVPADGIDKDLDNVKELVQTEKTVENIRSAAAPLTGQAGEIITAAGAIDKNAKSILGTAGSINTTAKSINGTVRSINSSVRSIGASVVQINQRVNSIGSNVFTINSTAKSIFALVGPQGASDPASIKASVTRILRGLRAVDPVTRSIDPGVAAINGRADKAIPVVRSINLDLNGTLGKVGIIDTSANSIDCAPVLNVALIGGTTGCKR